jgi:outer membrane protein OmpA-like peptidoglycan-associated protein
VYDGTKGGFSMSQLDKLDDNLEKWEGELKDTISLVGYTANTWTKESCKQLSLNVKWVVVLAA